MTGDGVFSIQYTVYMYLIKGKARMKSEIGRCDAAKNVVQCQNAAVPKGREWKEGGGGDRRIRSLWINEI